MSQSLFSLICPLPYIFQYDVPSKLMGREKKKKEWKFKMKEKATIKITLVYKEIEASTKIPIFT